MRDFPDELDAVLTQGLVSSQRWFVACFVLSPCVYYFLDPYSDNRFPATISWTIRKGIPKWTQHFLWGMGWGSALLAMHHSGQVRAATASATLVDTRCCHLFEHAAYPALNLL
jgi:hypothetical protein